MIDFLVYLRDIGATTIVYTHSEYVWARKVHALPQRVFVPERCVHPGKLPRAAGCCCLMPLDAAGGYLLLRLAAGLLPAPRLEFPTRS